MGITDALAMIRGIIPPLEVNLMDTIHLGDGIEGVFGFEMTSGTISVDDDPFESWKFFFEEADE